MSAPLTGKHGRALAIPKEVGFVPRWDQRAPKETCRSFKWRPRSWVQDRFSAVRERDYKNIEVRYGSKLDNLGYCAIERIGLP